MHVKNGTKQAFSGSHTKLSAGQHSSSVPYPMSLCCWDKVLFVCPWLLARAHRALKLCLNDGIFISSPPFRARSHPSLLSLCTETQPAPSPPNPPTFLLATGRVGRYCSDTSTICVTSSFLYWITASVSHEKFQTFSDTFLCNSSLGCALNI